MKEQNIGICCAAGQVALHEFEKQVTLTTVSSLLWNITDVSDTGFRDTLQHLFVLFENTRCPLMTLSGNAHRRKKNIPP